MQSDYIPRPDRAFLEWVKNLYASRPFVFLNRVKRGNQRKQIYLVHTALLQPVHDDKFRRMVVHVAFAGREKLFFKNSAPRRFIVRRL